MISKKMKIVFFGTPEFAAYSLKAIISHGIEVAAVVTTPDRKGGRGNKIIESDVKKTAIENNLKVLQPEKLRDPEFIDTLKSLNADAFVVIAFRMLPEAVWSIPPMGTFNLHASLLPQLRGAAPINYALIYGFKTSGVTTFMINHRIDEGEILLKSETAITPDDDAGTLHDRLMEMGAELVVKTLDALAENSLVPVPQNPDGEVLPAPKIFKPDCRINFKQPASKIINHVRGLSPYPAAWCEIELDNGKVIEAKILKMKPSESGIRGLTPGECCTEWKHLEVGVSDGSVEILLLQPAGKKPMDSKAFLAGYHPLKMF